MGAGGGSKGASASATASGGTATTNGTATASGLTSAERNALDHYSGTGYADINGMLRGTYKPRNAMDRERIAAAKGHAAQLDAAMSKSALAHSTVLWRGTGLNLFGGKLPAVGSVLRDKAFMSTSRSRDVAQHAFNRGVLLKITASKGTRAVDVSHHVGGNEREVLLSRGARLKVTKVTREGNLDIIHAKVLK